jgi:hypothetical protein
MRVTGTTVGPRFQCEGALAQLTSLKPAGLVSQA